MKKYCKITLKRTVGIVTALNPVLGYEKTTELAKEALQTGKGILELIREKKLLTEAQIKDLMDPAKMTGPPKTISESYYNQKFQTIKNIRL